MGCHHPTLPTAQLPGTISLISNIGAPSYNLPGFKTLSSPLFALLGRLTWLVGAIASADNETDRVYCCMGKERPRDYFILLHKRQSVISRPLRDSGDLFPLVVCLIPSVIALLIDVEVSELSYSLRTVS